MKKLIAGLFLLPLLFSCNMKQKVDLLVYNARVYTVDSIFSTVEAFAVKDGKIIECGSDDYILGQYSADSYLDCEYKFLYPGFNDAHCHFLSLGRSLNIADLRGAESAQEVVARVKRFASGRSLRVITGEGWDQNLWQSKEFPDNELLNREFPDIPVVLKRIDFHAVLVNEAAIKALGITPESESIPAGEAIIKNGKFTGVFLEGTGDRFKDIIPEPTEEEFDKIIETAQNECLKYGLTSVSDADQTFDGIEAISKRSASGLLKLRMDVWLSPSKKNLDNYTHPYRSERLNISTLKLYLDGALGSRGAWLLEPYSDDRSTYGIRVLSRAQFREYCEWAYSRGFQVATHCIGDAACREALQVYGDVLGEGNSRRWRVEHSQIIAEGDFDLFGKFSITPSVQPTHATSDMFWADERLGERIKRAYAYKRLLEQNGWLPSGTDFPIEEVNPINTFYSAVYRKNSKMEPAEGFQMENALTREEALRSMTIWAAKASFDEDVKGSIEPGKYADFVILDRDIIKCPENEILRTKVLKTFIGGEDLSR